MKIQYIRPSDFKSLESITEHKVLLDICDMYKYDVTDSNEFYSMYYVKPKLSFEQQPTRKYGEIFFTNIFSYHQICHMICVEWPKSILNIQPFKYKHFEKCCVNLSNHLKENNIKLLCCPVFGKEILEGNWNKILDIMNKTFGDITLIIIK